MQQNKGSVPIIVPFAYSLGLNLLLPIIPLYITSIIPSIVQLGLITSTVWITSITVRIPILRIVERLGKYNVMMISFILQATYMICYFLASSVIWLYVAAVLHGLSWSLFEPTTTAVYLEAVTPSKRGQAMGKYLAPMGVAMTVGPLLTSILLKYTDYRNLFILAVIAPLSATALLKSVIKMEAEPSAGRMMIGATAQDTFRLVLSLLKSKKALLSLLGVTMFPLTMASFNMLFPVYLNEVLFLSPSEISILFAIKGMFDALTRFPAGRLADRIGSKQVFFLGMSLMAAAFLSIPYGQSVLVLSILVGIYGLGFAFAGLSSVTLLSDATSLRDRTIMLAHFFTTQDIGFAVGASAVGAFAILLSIPSVFVVSALTLVLGIAIVRSAG